MLRVIPRYDLIIIVRQPTTLKKNTTSSQLLKIFNTENRKE